MCRRARADASATASVHAHSRRLAGTLRHSAYATAAAIAAQITAPRARCDRSQTGQPFEHVSPTTLYRIGERRETVPVRIHERRGRRGRCNDKAAR